MQFCEGPGIVRDMLDFNIFYYSEMYIESFFKNIFKHGNYFDYRNELLQDITPPEAFAPFFWGNEKCIALFTAFTQSRFHYAEDDITSLLYLIQDKELFRPFIYRYFWEPLQDKVDLTLLLQNDAESLSNFLFYCSLPSEIAEKVVHLFFHYDETINALVDYLILLADKVKALHSRYHEEALTLFSRVNHELFHNWLYQIWNIDDSAYLDDICISVGFVNNYNFYSDYKEKKGYIILGIDSEEIIQYTQDSKSLTSGVINENFFNPVKNDILHELNRCPQTATQLSEKLNVSRTAMARHISNLRGFCFIEIDRRTPHEIFYTVNKKYIEAAQRCVQEEFRYLLGRE